MLYLILSFQNELVDNVKVHEPLGSSDHNQIHFNIKVKTGTTSKKNNRGGTSTKANIISDGFEMAEVLSEYFSSVFTT